ncbi:trypsin-like serine protease [Nonomuraea sp. NPDC050556]|uniref:trypsin-like serine protease n=1 Tax=Nonomuraea sp. NPDC050556 TaxID=3364369 RepID=UPI00378CA9A1
MKRILIAAAGVALIVSGVTGVAQAGTDVPAANYEGGTVPTGLGDVSPKFYGGQDATLSEFPAIIAGLREGGPRPQGQSCTGSVIAKRKILIAAHCADAAGMKSFLYGLDDLNAGGGTRLTVKEYAKHPQYVNFDQGYDVAVVTTNEDIPVPQEKWATFATSADAGSAWRVGDNGLGFGYGKKTHDDSPADVTLDKATLPIVDGARVCTGVGAGFKAETMICAGYGDGHITILPGDSGGPLIVGGKVVGVASWSRSDFKWYSVYGRLDNDMGDWVKKKVEEDQPPSGFTLGVSPSSVRVDPGGYISTNVTTTAGNSPESVELSASGLPSGAEAVFQPRSIPAGRTAKLTVKTSSTTPAGEHKITVTGTGSSGTRSTTLTLTVGGTQPGDLTISLSPSAATIQPGFSVISTVKAPGATSPVTLTASGAPAGVTVQFLPATVNPGGSSTLFLTTSFSVAPGTYKIKVTGTGGGKSGSADFTLTIARR